MAGRKRPVPTQVQDLASRHNRLVANHQSPPNQVLG